MNAEIKALHPRMDPIEKEIILQVIDDALTADGSISVYDGDISVVSKSNDAATIFRAMYSTGSDTLVLRKGNENLGRVTFIYDNEGWDVIADSTANEYTDDVLKNASRLAEMFAEDDEITLCTTQLGRAENTLEDLMNKLRRCTSDAKGAYDNLAYKDLAATAKQELVPVVAEIVSASTWADAVRAKRNLAIARVMTYWKVE